MPAVVRIKRRIDEEPHTAFVLNGKRRRLEEEDDQELSTVLKFAGTLENQDDSATKQFAAARLNKASAQELVQSKSHTSGDASAHTHQRRDRQRQATQQASRDQRFRVVNCLRTTLDEGQSEAAAAASSELENPAPSTSAAVNAASSSQQQQQQITIVDIESQQARTADPTDPSQQPADSDIGYVYDLYVPENEQQAAFVDMMDDNYLSVKVADELFFEDCYNNEEEDYDSEDSNQEDYYTNDYPDAEDEGVMGSDDELCQGMQKFMFDDDESDGRSSSDDEDINSFRDPYVHSIDTEVDSFVDDVDFCNSDRQGSAYERYKRRVLRELGETNSSDEDKLDDDNDDLESPLGSVSDVGN